MPRRKSDILLDIESYGGRLTELEEELAALPEGSYQVLEITTDNSTFLSPGRITAHSLYPTREEAKAAADALNAVYDVLEAPEYDIGPPVVYYVSKVV
jgi:hypothetical protein